MLSVLNAQIERTAMFLENAKSKNDLNKEAMPKLIWDLPLRFFHWGMVLVVFIAAITGYFFEEWWLDIHVYAGYALTCLLIFRFIWGFLGSYYSRFHTFPLARPKIKKYIKSFVQGNRSLEAGHNPLGAWMIVILLSTLTLLIITGFLVWGGQENNGPLANIVGYQVGDFSEDIHETLANILMVVIGVHLCGVFIETFLYKHPLIKSMISGMKTTTDTKSTASLWDIPEAVLIFCAIIIGFTYWVNATDSIQKLSEVNPAYHQECAECHPAYHPSLRTAQSWQSIMGDLSNHYSEDASLDPATTQEISLFLAENNAQSFDTEVAHKIGRKETPSMRMTDTRYWKKKHHDFNESDFKHSSIGSKANCNACHQDADTGRFDDAKIKLPKGLNL